MSTHRCTPLFETDGPGVMLNDLNLSSKSKGVGPAYSPARWSSSSCSPPKVYCSLSPTPAQGTKRLCIYFSLVICPLTKTPTRHKQNASDARGTQYVNEPVQSLCLGGLTNFFRSQTTLLPGRVVRSFRHTVFRVETMSLPPSYKRSLASLALPRSLRY